MRSPVSALMFSLLVACSGAVPGVDDDGGGSGGNRPGGRGGDGVAANCPSSEQVDPGPSPLRRLTNAEYNNTVADLLGDDSAPANSFPNDSRVHGFDNHVSTQTVTYTLADYTFKAAENLAAAAVGRLESLYDCNVGDTGETPCAKEFIAAFGRRAYRRPLDDAEKDSLFALYEKGRQGGGDFKKGIRFVLTRMLASPAFLYRPELGAVDGDDGQGFVQLTSWEVASRLSYLFWGTMPDGALFEAADRDELSSKAQVQGQVERMLADPKAKAGLRRFYSGWLKLDAIAQSTKDEKMFPGHDTVVPAMVEEIHRMMDDILWDDEGTVDKLFTADYTFINRDLAAFVGMKEADAMSSDFERVSLSPKGPPSAGQRMGILASPGLLSAQSKPQETSPLLRGLFVLEQVLCMEMPLPPAGVPPLEVFDTTGLTTRERFEKHSESACASCHKFIDPIGFAFENFDAAGRFRDSEKGKPINTAGELVETDVDGPFDNSVELSQRFASSERIRKCVATQWFRFAMGRGETDEQEHSLEQLACGFSQDSPIKSMLASFAETDAFRYRSTEGIAR